VGIHISLEANGNVSEKIIVRDVPAQVFRFELDKMKFYKYNKSNICAYTRLLALGYMVERSRKI
jgi:hypothetical protein